MKPVIRPYQPNRDLPGVRACLIALQDHEHEFAPEAPTGHEIADDYLHFMLARSGPPLGHLLVAEVDGEVVGFATLLVRERDEPDDTDPVHAEVAELSVLPEYRGRGFGKALLAKCEAIARTTEAASLRVRVDWRNPGARRLYERLGFDPLVLQLRKPLR